MALGKSASSQETIAPLSLNYCGPNALLVALTLLDVETRMERILGQVQLTERGTSLNSLRESANAHGVNAVGYRLDWGSLQNAVKGRGSVAIVDVDGHFVVLTAVGDSLFVVDPPRGPERVVFSRPDLSDRIGLAIPVKGARGVRRILRWTGIALIISKPTPVTDFLGGSLF